jgi:hypothetical protein
VSKSDQTSGVLRRLLGPGRPELSCEQCFEELDRYVELMVAGADAEIEVPGMQAHLEGCSACAEDYESLKELVTGANPPPPPEPV